jgi:RNA polymerase primary sigma factor
MRQLIISQSITQRDYYSLDRYFNEINKIDLITANEEVLLAEKIRQGDQYAFQRLVSTNLRFVVSVAKQYQNKGISLGDLINEGNMGLITAAKRFDHSKGFKFISYAVWWIRQSIIFAIAEQSRIVHLPYNLVTLLGKFNSAFSKLEQEYKRKPSLDEVSEYLDVDRQKIENLLACSKEDVSIDSPINNHEESTLLDILSNADAFPDHEVIKDSVKEVIQQSLNTLGPRDREVVQLYFGLNINDPLPLEEIAKKFNLSIEHTRRLKDNALQRLSKSPHSPLLKSCLS